jgi:hypothetical protein
MHGLLFSTGSLIFAARLRRSPLGLTGLESAASQALLISPLVKNVRLWGSQRLDARLVGPVREKPAKTKRAPPMDIISNAKGQLFFPAFPAVLWWGEIDLHRLHGHCQMADFFLLVAE